MATQAPSRPNIKARFPSVCSACGKAIPVGHEIAKAASGWVHVPCPGVSKGQADTDRLKAELAKARADLAKVNMRLAEVNGVNGIYRKVIAELEAKRDKAPKDAYYSDTVQKLLNLAIGASTDAEAMAAFSKARKLHSA